jgi:hypothetical protein
MEKLERTRAEIEEDGGTVPGIYSAELRDEAAVRDLVRTVLDRHGRMHGLVNAAGLDGEAQRAALGDLVRLAPRSSAVWAALGQCARDDVEAYAYFRVGYHRGLDALRANGWRGSGYVRWAAPSNHGFLRSLLGLSEAAERLGELDEAERCRLFLGQCDPSGVPEHR